MSREIIERIARRYEGRWLQGYVRGKLRSDPVYGAAFELLKNSPLPVLDVGCGIGLLGCYLREHGFAAPLVSFDFDAGKIAKAQRATASYSSVEFHAANASSHTGQCGNVMILDVLHYLDAAGQRALLERVAAMVPSGGCCAIRATPRDASWRFSVTRIEEWFLRTSRWMKSGARHYLSAEEVCAPFLALGFTCEARPLWGRTPFNSHLFVFHAPAATGLG